MITLGIETSCDETAAAIFHSKIGLLSNVLYSQLNLQKDYGGVVPEIASRSHLEKINEIVQKALHAADVSLDDIKTIAVTNKPGLPGSLLIGLCFAKGLAYAADKKLIGVNHLEGHIFSSFLNAMPPFPHLCLTASGGHTSMYIVHGFGNVSVLGHTLDDAAGEAFDKIAKMINLPYPGGPEIERLARKANFQDFFAYPRGKHNTLDFSFSGLKTAVMYDLMKKGFYNFEKKCFIAKEGAEIYKMQVASSLLVCIKDIFLEKLNYALAIHPTIHALTFVGGVASNNYLKTQLTQFALNNSIAFFSPPREYCTDNAAMIAFVGNYKARFRQFNSLKLDIFQ